MFASDIGSSELENVFLNKKNLIFIYNIYNLFLVLILSINKF